MQRKNTKKQFRMCLIVTLIIAALLLTTGCGGSEIRADKNGNPLKYSISEIYNGGLYGTYVLKEGKQFIPLMSYYTSFDDCVWWTDGSAGDIPFDGIKLMPSLEEGDSLVIVSNSAIDLKQPVMLYKYGHLGATFGAHALIGTDGTTMYFSKEDDIAGSNMGMALESSGLSMIEVVKINELENLPLDNIDASAHLLLGLEKNKFYKIQAYLGTSTREITVKADTDAFKLTETYCLNEAIRKTDMQYFVIDLPDNLSPGYYLIGNGMFKVEEEG